MSTYAKYHINITQVALIVTSSRMQLYCLLHSTLTEQ